MELREIMKVQTEFIKVRPRGAVTFKYSFQLGRIKIDVDLSCLDPDECEEILILNEQGSTFFNRYSDTDGTRLLNEKIGAWAMVSAAEASLSNSNETLTFTVARGPGMLFRGWEKTKSRFSWAGLSYSLPPQSFTFDYIIKLRER
jgi:hypothetical protein